MHRWKLSALAAATFATAALTTTDAFALALGTLTVRSALGENLDAEIAIPQATAAELNALAARIAAPEVFRAQGLDYSGAARAIQAQLQRNADGSASIRLRSDTPIQDPFVDVVLETQWPAGHLVRSYTLLLDPPSTQRAAAAPTAAAQIAAAPAPAASDRAGARSPRPTPVQRPVPTAAAPEAATDTPTANSTATVRTGDTAGRIASAHRPKGVSLDQMLVAMLRHNPDAFIQGNVNRMRAGAVLQLPSREQALETSRSEARQIVAAQSRDFHAYRRSLASKAPQATVQAADRSASGQVQAQVADTRPAADQADKLTLSKGSVQNVAAEAQVAEQKQADEQDERLSELQRNLAQLNELAQNTAAPEATAAAAAEAPPPAATAPAAAETPETPLAALEMVNTTAAAASETPAEAPTAAEPTEPAPVPLAQASLPREPVPAPLPTPAEAGLLDHPLVPAGAGLLALLLGLLGYTAWKRRRATQAAQDPSLGDSHLPPDSFFGSSGGQQVDTSSTGDALSTMAYAPSQLDGGGDVDPVAEADVYLAYGRDTQAEEILKEALRNQPERLSIHVKLAEIYAKRYDRKSLEEVARGMQPLCAPENPQWQRVLEIGRDLDPTHPLFAGASTAPATSSPPASAFAAALSAMQPAMAQPLPDLDADLHLSDAAPGPAASLSTPSSAAPLPSEADFAALEHPMLPDSAWEDMPQAETLEPSSLVQDSVMPEAQHAADASALELDLSGLELPASTQDAAPTAADEMLNLALPETASTAAEPAPAAGLDFDLGSLDLDLGDHAAPAALAEPVHNLADDPLSTKLDLAQEFNSIGDSEGARALIEEVLAEASGSLKERAQQMRAELD